MTRPRRRIETTTPMAVAWSILLAGAIPMPVAADRIEMADGRTLEGKFTLVEGVGIPPEGAADRRETPGAPVLVCDDGLTRSFVPRKLVRGVEQGGFDAGQEVFKIEQRVPEKGRRLSAVGGILETTPFDPFGRRILSVATGEGRLDIVQGITRISPRWTRIEGILTDQPIVVDTRVATSSIPLPQLQAVIDQQLDRSDSEERLRVVRFLLQAERFEEASRELDGILADFPERADLSKQRAMLGRLSATRLLDELALRTTAGQEKLALEWLETFPTENVDGETLEAIRERRDSLRSRIARAQELLDSLESLLPSLAEGPDRDAATEIVAEMRREMSFASLPRLATFERFSSDGSTPPPSAIALAITGWLEGSGGSRDNLKLALSAGRVRGLVRDYLAANRPVDRDAILRKLSAEEAFDPPTVARLAAAMRPPIEPPPAIGPGLHELAVASPSGGDSFACLVQLPPEYDPLRRYPAIVTLHAGFTTPTNQIDWWAGGPGTDGSRRGQALRHGFIVVAPAWARPSQTAYEYSAREHAAVLASLREATRRFAIDTDRVFLSGHSMGADAAWDMALAHPDLWAGLVGIVPTAGRYVDHYGPNARTLPIYLVGGELDGGRLATNSMDIDRCLKKGVDLTYVEYQGRGHENFSDEILRIFDWLKRKRRTFFPPSFEAVSMRPWDRFFWWIEFAGAPEKTVVLPTDWPPPAGARPLEIEAKASPGNTIAVRCGARRVMVWLSPEIVDFSKPATITLDGRQIHRGPIEPDPVVLLEDLRTRADRQHPFWLMIDSRPDKAIVP